MIRKPPGRRHLLIACLALAAPAFAENSFDGTYSGERVLTKGDPSGCVAKDTVSVTIHGSQLTFSNSAAKDYTIGFFPQSDGSFGQLSGNIGGDVVDIRGHVGNDVLDADVSGAYCTHHWRLRKQR